MRREQAHLDQRHAVALAVPLRDGQRFVELVLLEQAVADQHLAEKLAYQVGTHKNRIAVAYVNNLFNILMLQVQQARCPQAVKVVQDARESRLGQFALHRQPLRAGLSHRRADQVLDLFVQGLQGEWLEQIVGGTILFAGVTDVVCLLVECRHHDDRQVLRRRQGAQLLAELQTVGSRQEDVQQGEVAGEAVELLQGGFCIGESVHYIAVQPQGLSQDTADVGVVVDDQDVLALSRVVHLSHSLYNSGCG